MSATIRTILVDDEPLACELLRNYLKHEPDIEVIGEYHEGAAAVAAILEKKPDLLLLDVQIPDMDGFSILHTISGHFLPAVIFTTALDRYAVQAFDVHALDYLVKPFDRKRLQKALERARATVLRQRAGETDQRLPAMLESMKPEAGQMDRLLVKVGGKIIFLKTTAIDWIGAEGNYAAIHCGKDSYLLRETMRSLETRLNPQRFIRIHRSAIVNIDRIKELQLNAPGDYVVILGDGTRLDMSRNYRERFHSLFHK